jgi:tRNA threonylcarbamoyladenosine modification (KEOPS) complex  Pcc1 subunit
MKDELSNETLITIKYNDKDTARAVNSAISPDNLNTPQPIKIDTTVEGTTLKIKMKSNKLNTLIATLDDLLSCVQAAESALTEIYPKGD